MKLMLWNNILMAIFLLLNSEYQLIVDAIFGFSFKPPVRPQFVPILEALAKVNLFNI